MSWHKIKLDPADIAFSNYIRRKAKYICEKDGTVCRIDGKWVVKMDASHYWSRGRENVRFDERNVHALCSTCHKRMGGHTKNENGEYDLWMKELLGEVEFDRLKIDANIYKKRDRKMSLIIVKEMIKALDKEQAPDL